MKKRISPFIAGMLTTAILGFLGITALAATGAVTFNVSNLSLNGTQISAKGENYTLANGQSVPASITYTDEKGGGTTYLPVRRIAELMGVETGWDGATGSVTVKGEVKAPAEPTTPPDTTASTDYSDWSKEDEAAYQEFKGMCSVTPLSEPEKLYANPSKIYAGIELPLSDTTQYNIDCRYDLKETAELRTDEQVSYWNKNIKDIQVKYAERLTKEIHANNPRKSTAIVFRWRDLTTMVTAMYGGGTYVSEVCVKE